MERRLHVLLSAVEIRPWPIRAEEEEAGGPDNDGGTVDSAVVCYFRSGSIVCVCCFLTRIMLC